MEINDSLLVAMMFVMILSIGIAGVLDGIGTLVRSEPGHRHWLPVAWIVLVLFSHLELFWHTVLIVDVEDWRFTGFLYMISGPILLFLAVGVLTSAPKDNGSILSLSHYAEVSPYFFTLLALLMLWTIGADYALDRGFSSLTVLHVVECLIFAVLALNRGTRLHRTATVLTVAVVVAAVLFEQNL